MNNGTSQAVLVHELFVGDGPHQAIADAFVAHVCMACFVTVQEAPQFGDTGFYCGPCSSNAA